MKYVVLPVTIRERKHYYYQIFFADDRKMIIPNPDRGYLGRDPFEGLFMLFSAFGIVAIFLYSINYLALPILTILIHIILFIVVVLPTFVFLNNYLKSDSNSDVLELHRLEGKIRFPSKKRFLGFSRITSSWLDFKDCKFVVQRVRTENGSYDNVIYFLKSGITDQGYYWLQVSPPHNISFLYWYMDKNRPLPPDKRFDPYRQVDFERRRAEGFPKPLYPSSIRTLECTGEKRKERKDIGGW